VPKAFENRTATQRPPMLDRTTIRIVWLLNAGGAGKMGGWFAWAPRS
jgi:hypothetical protein